MIFKHKHQNGLSKSRTLVYGLTFFIQILALVNLISIDKHPLFGSTSIYFNLAIVVVPIILVYLESHFLKNIKAEHTMSIYFKAFFVISSLIALAFLIYLIAFLTKVSF